MFEGVLTALLTRLLGEYVKAQCFTRDKVQASVYAGHVSLVELELRHDALDFLQLPLTVARGFVGKVILRIPWHALGSRPVSIVQPPSLCKSGGLADLARVERAYTDAAAVVLRQAGEKKALAARVTGLEEGNRAKQRRIDRLAHELDAASEEARGLEKRLSTSVRARGRTTRTPLTPRLTSYHVGLHY